MLTSSDVKCNSEKKLLKFLPKELIGKYQSSDLEYDYCVMHFGFIQAAKRDSIPQETMRIWFKEFIRLGWGKFKFDTQYEALMQTDIIGYAIKIDHWINATKNFTPEYKPVEVREKQMGGLKGLREYIDNLDDKMKTKKPFYFDKETKEKIYYEELPPNWKAELTNNWRRGDRIKTELRKK